MRAALVVLLLLPSLAQAKTKIAVLDVKATGKVDMKQVEGLSSLIASEVSRSTRADVLSGSDLRAVMGYDKQKALLGCEETSCLAELGGALGADYIVGSEASQVGHTFLISLSLVDIRKVKVLSRLTKQTRSEDDLVAVTQQAVHEMVLPLPADLQAEAAPSPVPTEAVFTEAPPTVSHGSKAPSYVMWGLGLASGAAGAYLLVDANGKSNDYKTGVVTGPTYNLTQAQADSLKSDGERNRDIGWGLAGGAVLLAVIGILLLPGSGPPPPTSTGGTPLARF